MTIAEKTGTWFVLGKGPLSAALGIVERVVPGRYIVPITACVLIEPTPEGVRFTATDLTAAITTTVPTEKADHGPLALPAKALTEFVGSLSSGDVEVSSGGKTATIAAGGYRATLKCYPADEFPPTPEPPEDAVSVEIDAALLERSMERVAGALAKEQSRPVLSGMLLRVTGDRLVLAGADGWRIHSQELVTDRAGGNVEAILPGALVRHVLALMPDEGEVRIRIAAGKAWFDLGRTRVVGRLIEGKYPNFHQLMRDGSETTAVVPAPALRQACRALRVTEGAGSKMLCRAEEIALTFTATDAEVGEAGVTLGALQFGPEAEVALSRQFVEEVAASLGDAEVTVGINGASQAVMFTTEADPGFRALVVSMAK
jgi:DNA polymerase-3 subunit beta